MNNEPDYIKKVEPAFLGKLNRIRALVQNVFNTYQDQFDLFYDNPDLINEYPVLQPFIHNVHFLACTQSVHEKRLHMNKFYNFNLFCAPSHLIDNSIYSTDNSDDNEQSVTDSFTHLQPYCLNGTTSESQGRPLSSQTVDPCKIENIDWKISYHLLI